MASILNVDQINNAAGTSAITIDANGNALMAGHVVQVVQQENNTIGSFTGGSAVGPHYDILSLSITPTSASSKILVFGKATVGGSGVVYDFSVGLKRNGTLVGGNTNSSNWLGTNVMASGIPGGECPTTLNFEYLDSPATTSAVSYTLGVWGGEGATYYINRGAGVSSAANWANSGNSCLTLMEIAG